MYRTLKTVQSIIILRKIQNPRFPQKRTPVSYGIRA